MEAAGRNGIPCSFVVDQKGKLAYIGHPMFLGEVLPKVVAGSWKAKEGAAELAKVEEDINGVFKALSGADAAAGLKALADFEARRPALAHIPYFVGPKIRLLLKAKKADEAKKVADEVVTRATEQEDPTALRSVSAVLQSPEAKGDKALAGLSIRAAEAALKLSGDKDAVALYGVAEAHFAAGDKAKAREFGRKAVDAAAGESPELKKALEERTKRYDDEKKEDKK
jgi:hypothetical protein